MSFEIILPFLRPIAELILDPTISEIMVNGTNGCSRIYIEKDGRVYEVEGVSIPETQLQVACRHIARSLGMDISEAEPILDARLPDGSRVAAMFPPCSVEGTTLTIRKFDRRRFSIEELVAVGTLTPDVVSILNEAIERRQNILISGGAGTGKTTLLNALASLIPPDDRIITIEDTAEIQLLHLNVRRFEARRKQETFAPVTMADLLRAALRHRPDRIILGEVRGAEAFDLLQALNTGHSGSLSTIHADSAQLAISRFTNCVLQAKVELPFFAIRRSIADSVHILVHIERRESRRIVREVLRIQGFDHGRDEFALEPLFQMG